MRYLDAVCRMIAPGPPLCDGEPEKPCGCGADETCAQRNARRLARLEAAADMALDMVRGAHRAHQALPLEETDPSPETAQVRAALNLSFARAAKTLERATQLEARLHATGGTLNVSWRAPQQPSSRADHIRVRKTVVAFPIEAAIEAEAFEEEIDVFLAELEERIENAPDADDFAEYPQNVMVARVCHDLDLPRDWAIWAQDCSAPTRWPASTAPRPGRNRRLDRASCDAATIPVVRRARLSLSPPPRPAASGFTHRRSRERAEAGSGLYRISPPVASSASRCGRPFPRDPWGPPS